MECTAEFEVDSELGEAEDGCKRTNFTAASVREPLKPHKARFVFGLEPGRAVAKRTPEQCDPKRAARRAPMVRCPPACGTGSLHQTEDLACLRAAGKRGTLRSERGGCGPMCCSVPAANGARGRANACDCKEANCVAVLDEGTELHSLALLST